MERESTATKTLGQAIDAIIEALTSLDANQQVTAVRAACEHLKIRAPGNLMAGTESTGSTAASSAPSAPPSLQVDVRTLKQEKKPSSASEMAALVAFYLSELAPASDRKRQVQVEDMVKYFKQAVYPLPKQPRSILTNAKNAGYFDTSGDGKYRLNAVGYNLVAHNLPRASSAARSRKKPRE